MSQNPLIEFGLSVLAAAYSARIGRCSAWDVVRLQSITLRCVPDDQRARDMVLEFTESVRGNAPRAGEALSQSIYNWLDSLSVGTRADIKKSTAPEMLFEWQKRADLQ